MFQDGRLENNLTFHRSFDNLHSLEDFSKPFIDRRTSTIMLYTIEDLDCPVDKRSCLFDHVNMREDKACFRAFRVETMFKSAY